MKFVALILLLTCTQMLAADSALNIEGIVTDELGKPIAGATVQLMQRQFTPHTAQMIGALELASVRSGADGRFVLAANLPDEARHFCMLRASAAGRAMMVVDVRPDEPDAQRYRDASRRASMEKPWLILPPVRALRGIVVTADDKPVGGCDIVNSETGEAFRTAADGSFAIEKLPDTRASQSMAAIARLDFRQPDYVTRSTRVFSPAMQVTDDGAWHVVLEEGVAIKGTMTEEVGDAPVPFASVILSGRSGDGRNFSTTVWADQDGKFTARVPEETQLAITPDAPRDESGQQLDVAAPENVPPISVHAGQENPEINISFRKAQSIAGTLKIIPQEDPRSFYVRAATPDGKSISVAHVRSDGTFGIHAVPPGSYHLQVIQDRDNNMTTPLASKDDVEVIEGTNLSGVELTVDEVPERPQPVRGKVINADGTPAVLAIVRPIVARDRGSVPLTTDLEGAFELRDLSPPDACTLHVSDASRDNAATSALDPQAPANPLLLKLQPTAKLTGQVMDADNKPIKDVTVSLTQVSQQGKVTRHFTIAYDYTDEQGKYTIKGFVLPSSPQGFQIEARPTPTSGRRVISFQGHPIAEVESGQAQAGLNFRIREYGDRIEAVPEHE